jgi:hypothetical protein
MKAAIILSFLILAPTGHAASAAPFEPIAYTDVDVISVVPRNPDVKPFVMAIFTKNQLQRAAAFQKNTVNARDLNRAR